MLIKLLKDDAIPGHRAGAIVELEYFDALEFIRRGAADTVSRQLEPERAVTSGIPDKKARANSGKSGLSG